MEAIRASARFVSSIAQGFDAGSMPVSEAVNAYMTEFKTMERALQQLLTAR